MKIPAEHSFLDAHLQIGQVDGVCSSTIDQSTMEAFWEMDLITGQITYQQGFDDLFGEIPNLMTPFKWWFPNVSPQDRAAALARIRSVFRRKERTWREHYWFRHPDNTLRYVQDSGHIIYCGHKAVRFVGVFHDLTKIKTLEKNLLDERIDAQRILAETVIRNTERERSRIGQELHDNVNQLLACSVLFLDNIVGAGETDENTKKKCKIFVTSAIEEIRKLSKSMVMPSLSGPDLVSSIQTLINDITQATKISIEFSYCFGETKLSGGKRLAIYRIIQEQLKNILKHSGATAAWIELHSNSLELKLTIRDNGLGSDTCAQQSGIGLRNIQERVHFYGGTVTIQTACGLGFLMQVQMPRKKTTNRFTVKRS